MRTNDLAKPLAPPLKWAGGKRWLAPYLKTLWQPHQHRRLVEPFCGGLAIALSLQPRQALLNDINPHVINFYNWLQKGLIIQGEMCNAQDFYYARRDEFNTLIQKSAVHYPAIQNQRAAELFYYLNRTGYNGLCRFNKKGGYNVPFGRYKTINYRHNFTDYQSSLKNWQFTTQDFLEITLNPEDLIYADPPYDVEFRQYAKQGFTWNDQERLAHWLAAHSGPVIASNQSTDRIKELYRSLDFRSKNSRLLVGLAVKGDRAKVGEIVALKNL